MEMKLVEAQRAFFNSGKTRSDTFRLQMLKRLKQAVVSHEQQLCQAMKQDLNKPSYEGFLTEIGLVLDEINVHIRHLKGWMKCRRVAASVGQLPGRCYLSPEPYGVTLILSPWNYPILLCLEPLVGAISGGNTAILKPSAYAPACSAALAALIGESFDASYIAVVEGGREQNTALLQQKFDYIFFTGSAAVGKIVMQQAAQYVTPVTLELGGKSPVIVDETANIGLAAKRIAFGKVINAGQTCVAPDYLLIQESVKEEFIRCYQSALTAFFPNEDWSDMATIINAKHFERVKGLMGEGTVVLGGQWDEERRWIAPTLIDHVTGGMPIMQEEIFGPLLPMLTIQNLDQAIEFIRARPKPLALYLFTQQKAAMQQVMQTCSFGGGCINDTVIHLATSNMPFGGVGASGMGAYHGKKSFETFTHTRSILRQSTHVDVPLRYRPYTKKKESLLKKIFR